MTMTPGLRKFALAVHVTSSVGWLGAVVVFLALAVVGLTSQDGQTVRGAYLVMEPAAGFVLVPLAFASLLTGLVMSLGTTWGLFQHYWVLFKFLISAFATIVLLIYMETFSYMAGVAADSRADLGVVRNASPMLHAALALLVLLVATVLAVYKPRGVTPYGRRRLHEQRAGSQPLPPRRPTVRRNGGDTQMADLLSHPDSNDDTAVRPDRSSTTSTPGWVKVSGIIIIIALFLLVVALHLAGRGMGSH